MNTAINQHGIVSSIIDDLSYYRSVINANSEFMRLPVELADRIANALRAAFGVDQDEEQMRVYLPNTQYLIYRELRRADGRMLRSSYLRAACRSKELEISEGAFQVHLCRLRASLAEIKPELELHNVRGYGYFLARKSG